MNMLSSRRFLLKSVFLLTAASCLARKHRASKEDTSIIKLDGDYYSINGWVISAEELTMKKA